MGPESLGDGLYTFRYFKSRVKSLTPVGTICEEAMKVYILETGCYEDRYTHGIYSTPEKAMAAWHPDPSKSWHSAGYSYTWGGREKDDDDGVDYGWEFDADWEDAARVREYEVDEP